MQTFATYPEARAAAERIVRELASGSQSAALTASQSRDALAAFERLQAYYQKTGRKVSLLAGHIDITAGKSKTRSRRLVEIFPALAAWLGPYRASTKGKIWNAHEITFQQKVVELCEAAKVTRKTNGLRHAFCTYHFALHAMKI